VLSRYLEHVNILASNHRKAALEREEEGEEGHRGRKDV
jgi:hypothetical protein